MAEPVTLITGTRKGIGRQLADYYCEKGHAVIGCSRGAVEWSHDRYRHVPADVTDEKETRKVFDLINHDYGRLDNLINKAGIAMMNHALLTPISAVRKVFDTNVIGSFLFCREAAKLMRKRKYGRIVNFSTIAVPLKLEGEAAYVASKAAVQGLTDVLAKEFAAFGITVNTVGPVPVETDLIRSVPKDKIDRIINRQSVRRLGTIDDVANVVDFLLDPASSMVTGQHIFLGGL